MRSSAKASVCASANSQPDREICALIPRSRGGDRSGAPRGGRLPSFQPRPGRRALAPFNEQARLRSTRRHPLGHFQRVRLESSKGRSYLQCHVSACPSGGFLCSVTPVELVDEFNSTRELHSYSLQFDPRFEPHGRVCCLRSIHVLELGAMRGRRMRLPDAAFALRRLSAPSRDRSRASARRATHLRTLGGLLRKIGTRLVPAQEPTLSSAHKKRPRFRGLFL